MAEDILFKGKGYVLEEPEALIACSGGDARKLLNLLELSVNVLPPDSRIIAKETVKKVAASNPLMYDKDGEQHYDLISAMIKSVRGSDSDAALYWMARMLAGGEDPKFIARKLIISASEDIGLANPNAMLIADACFEAVYKIGMLEAWIPLAE